jgi:predicted nucleic acid-binding protein
VTSCVLDTDVVIAALDRADAHHADAARLLGELADLDVPLLMSTVNYAEALVRPAERKHTLRLAVGAIEALCVTVVPPTPEMARDAATFRGISLADGFALATARARRATVASFDKRVRRSLEDAGLRLTE